MSENEGIYPHKCTQINCDIIVQFDDEPYCFEHSPETGSSIIGYSAKRAEETLNLATSTQTNKPGKTWCTPHNMHPKDCFPLHHFQYKARIDE